MSLSIRGRVETLRSRQLRQNYKSHRRFVGIFLFISQVRRVGQRKVFTLFESVEGMGGPGGGGKGRENDY